MSEPTKPTSEKIFDILGLLVADPFRRWLIVGYIIFNPDLFILFFTSKEKFEIFQQYFKLNYCPWSSAIGDYFSLRIQAIYQFLSWPLYHIIFPFFFSYFWCFVYPRFEIWYRERMKENQDKIKDIKDNNILQTKIRELNKSLQTEKTNYNILSNQYNHTYQDYINTIGQRYTEMLPKINEYIGEIDLNNEYIRDVFKGDRNDKYEHCIDDNLANKIKRHFDYKQNEFLYIEVNSVSEIISEKECVTYLKLITLNTQLTQDKAGVIGKHLIFLVKVMYRLYKLKNTPNDRI